MGERKRVKIGNYTELLEAINLLNIIAKANPLVTRISLAPAISYYPGHDAVLGFNGHRFHLTSEMRATISRDIREIDPDEISEYKLFLTELLQECLHFIISWLTSDLHFPELKFDIFSDEAVKKRISSYDFPELFQAQSQLLSLYYSHMIRLTQKDPSQAGELTAHIKNEVVTLKTDELVAIQFAMGLLAILLQGGKKV